MSDSHSPEYEWFKSHRNVVQVAPDGAPGRERGETVDHKKIKARNGHDPKPEMGRSEMLKTRMGATHCPNGHDSPPE